MKRKDFFDGDKEFLNQKQMVEAWQEVKHEVEDRLAGRRPYAWEERRRQRSEQNQNLAV